MNRWGVREHFVYWMFAKGDTCLYVGMTRQPERRWRQHQQRKPQMTAQVATRRMAGPFPLQTARRIEREEQRRLNPVYVEPFTRERRLVVDIGSLRYAAEVAGFQNDQQLADGMGITPSQLSRVLSGACQPGNRFLAGLATVFGVESLQDLLIVLPDEEAA